MESGALAAWFAGAMRYRFAPQLPARPARSEARRQRGTGHLGQARPRHDARHGAPDQPPAAALKRQSGEEDSDGRPVFRQPEEVVALTERRCAFRLYRPSGGRKGGQAGIDQVEARGVLLQRLGAVIA